MGVEVLWLLHLVISLQFLEWRSTGSGRRDEYYCVWGPAPGIWGAARAVAVKCTGRWSPGRLVRSHHRARFPSNEPI